MPTRGIAGLLALAALSATCGGLLLAREPSVRIRAAGAGARAAYGRLPMRFEANRGQTDPSVRFVSRGPGYGLFLTPDDAVLSLSGPAGRAVVRMGLVGGSAQGRLEPAGRHAGVSNYLVGGDRRGWRTGVPAFSAVRRRDAYPGVDLLFHGRGRALEYDFEVAPRADPSPIALRFAGIRRLSLARSGDLLLHTAAGTLRQQRPVVFQRIGGARRRVAGRFELRGDGRVGFRLGMYDRSRALTIDPVLSYSTYLGGTGTTADAGQAIAVDSTGSAYIAGGVNSADFPVRDAVQTTRSCAPGGGLFCDAFVTKLSPDGSAVVYSTYLGGTDADEGNAIAVDATGHVYVSGNTSSSDFPLAAAQDATCGIATCDASLDAFVTKLAPDGTSLAYSTYLGGAGDDLASAIAVDGAGAAYVTGRTGSADFPTTIGAFDATVAATDAFVTKLGPGGALDYSTVLGGSGREWGRSIAQEDGDAYLAGQTCSDDFPTTAGALQTTAGGACDAFVAKVGATGSALGYSTYLGGSETEDGARLAGPGIAVRAGSAYVGGRTASPDFPLQGGFQATLRGGADAYVAKVDPSGGALEYSTLLGGDGADDEAGDVAVDAVGRAYVAGGTDSDDFPAVDKVARRGAGDDAFLARVRADGSGMDFSTTLGGTGFEDRAFAVAVDGAANAYLTGVTDSSDFPTARALQSANAGGHPFYENAFVAKVSTASDAAPLVTNVEPRSGPAGTQVTISGRAFTGASAVRFGDAPAAQVTVLSATRIVAIAPGGPTGPVPVVVTDRGGDSPPNPVARFDNAEGSWSDTGSMSTGRVDFSATLLRDGRVLVAGGQSVLSGEQLSSAELYDPRTGAWTLAGSMGRPRSLHTASLLADGRVLVAGGSVETIAGSGVSAEIYDPRADAWSDTADLNVGRQYHTQTTLADGRVLVAGGLNVRSAEVFDPAANGGAGAWSLAAGQVASRFNDTATLLRDGRVFAFGGSEFGAAESSAELFDARIQSWTATSLPDAPVRTLHSATLLADGTVLVAGGAGGLEAIMRNFVSVYDPAAATWTTRRPMRSERFGHGAALLPDGRVLVVGGSTRGPFFNPGLDSAEVYDPQADLWSSAGLTRVRHRTPYGETRSVAAIVLSSSVNAFEADPAVCGSRCGKVLVFGGDPSGAAELFTLAPRPQPAEPAAADAGPGAAAAPAPGPQPGPARTASDRTAPVLRGLRLSRARFRAAAHPVRGRGRSTPRGTAIRFGLSEDATVRFALRRIVSGRRVRGRCVTATPSNRRARRCERAIAGGAFAVHARAGANRRSFSGAVRGIRLRPGRYRLIAIAVDRAGNRSRPSGASFTVVRR